MSDKPTIEERYACAANTGNLKMRTEGASDVDKLLAAGLVTHNSPRMQLSLEVYRVLTSPDMRGARMVASKMADVMRRRVVRGKAAPITWVTAYDLSMHLLKVWRQRVCPACHGHGSQSYEGTPVLNLADGCGVCHSTGLLQLDDLVRPEHVYHARWMDREIHAICSIAFHEMAERLR